MQFHSSPNLVRTLLCATAAAGFAGLSACTADEALRPPAPIAVAPAAVAPPAPVVWDMQAAVEMYDPQPVDPVFTPDLADSGAEPIFDASVAEEPPPLARAPEPVVLAGAPLGPALARAAPVGVPPAPVPGPDTSRNYGYALPRPLEPAPMPASEVACRQRLKKLGVAFTDIAPINGPGQCGIAHPVKVSALPRGVRMKPAATLTCAMAEAFSLWARDELTPAARKRYFSGVATIHQGSSYSCRTIGNKRRGTLSAHAHGNAIDVMKITLRDGREIDVRKPGLFSFRERSLLNNVRGDACGYFTTVLGPGYNHDHRNHFHFDLMQRRSGRRACH